MRLLILAVLAYAARLTAQPAPPAPEPFFASIWSDSSAVVVTSASDSVWILVSTPWKSYTIHGDSASVANWADSAALSGATLTDTSGVHCTLALDRHGTLTASAPGSTSSIVLSTDASMHLNALLHGYRHVVFLPTSPADTWPSEPPNRRPDTVKFQKERTAQPVKGNVVPSYPDALLHTRITGVVLPQFVVDTMGRVVMSTVRMLKSPHPLMSFAVYQALASMRFTPATIGGRKVKELVQQTFTFGFKHPSLW